jgi:hypothetical protein
MEENSIGVSFGILPRENMPMRFVATERQKKRRIKNGRNLRKIKAVKDGNS